MRARSHATLAVYFARRMLPVSIVVGMVVALSPPLLYWRVAGEQLRTQAREEAAAIARAVDGVALKQPFFWRYNLYKLVGATAGHRSAAPLGEVRITDCAGGTLLSGTELGLGSGRTGGPAEWAPVAPRGRVIAWAEVTMDPAGLHAAVTRIAVTSTTVGSGLALLLFLFPTRVVRRQAGILGETLERLAAAEKGLVDANQDLRRRVDEAVREVRALSERVLSIQEEERGRMARDLHDSVGQLLTGLQIELGLIERRPDEAAQRAGDALDLCERTLVELRRVVRDLRPIELESGGLTEALRACAERFEVRTGVVTAFRHEGGEVRGDALSTCLLRVLQEALTNVTKHADALEVAVVFKVEPSRVALEVRDDGKGFDPGAPGAGAGLRSIRERVRFEGGTASVESAPGRGTRVVVELPGEGAAQEVASA